MAGLLCHHRSGDHNMPRIFVWDIFVRLFHWSLVGLFTANAFFTNPERSQHRYVGYAVAALLVARLVWGLIGSRHARFGDFPPSPGGSFRQVKEILSGRRHVHAGHSPLGALMIYNLLFTITAIAITGYMQTTITFFGYEWVEELHGALVTWAEISIVVHVLAVVAESRRLKVNLPRSMIDGYKTLPEQSSAT
jgi:cytochrome b